LQLEQKRHKTRESEMVRFLVGSSALALAFCSNTALAQVASENSDQTSNSERGIEEIIVTAQRREENVQKSSLAISVVGSDDLARAGVVSPRDLSGILPSVQITQVGANTQTYIRGVGDFSANGFAQLAVSYNIDGVNIDRPSAIGANFYDLARIEVLKGPQGTLYGRNATGGAVNLITNRPGKDPGGYLTAEYGNFDTKRLAGAFNLPIGETLAARFAFQVVDRDGFLSDGTDDDVQQAGRLQLMWEPNTDVSLRLSTDYAHQGGKGSGSVSWPQQPGTGRWTAISDPINNANLAVISGGAATPRIDNSNLDNETWNISAELNASLDDFATLTVLPAYRWQKLSQITNGGGVRFTNPGERAKQTSLEVRLGNQSDTLKWVVGGYYFNIDSSVEFLVNESFFISLFTPHANFPDVKTRSYAAFGEANFSVTDNLRLIGGLRYTDEKKSIAGRYTDESIAQSVDLAVSGLRKDSAVTWKAGVEFDAGPASMLYAIASKGFKSGGFFTAPAPDNSYAPEKLTAYSVGARNRFLGNTLQVNLEAFYWQYRNQQVSSAGFTNSGFVAFLTRNVGSSNPYGVDLDVVFKPTKSDTFNASLGYIHAEYERFDVRYPAPLLGSLVHACPAGAVVANPLPTAVLDCSGFQLARTPKWSGSASYQRTFDLASGASVDANLGMTFASGRFLSTEFFTPVSHASGYILANFDVTYTSPSGALAVTAFVKNIGNEAVYLGSQASLYNGNFTSRNIGAPRTYGARATVKF
jgi:iron complex outermembrane recepter protein